MQDPSLRDVRLFVNAVRLGSLSGASRALGMSPNAASLAVKRLEEMLRIQLLRRTTRSIGLTTEGRVYLQQCEHLLEAADAARGSVGPLRDALEGPIRVSAPSDLGRRRLLPMLDKFAEEHPAIRVDLWVSDDLQDLIDTRIDLALRYGAMADSDLVVRTLLADRRVAVASPTYLRSAPPIVHPEDLRQHAILMWQRPGRRMDAWSFEGPHGPITVHLPSDRSANDGAILRRWAIAGHGIVFKARLDVREELQSGELVDVLPQFPGKKLPLRAVFSRRGFRPARVQRLLDRLVEEFAGLAEDGAQ